MDMNGNIKFIFLSLYIIFTFESQLQAEVIIDNFEQIKQDIQSGVFPIIPVKFTDPAYNIVKYNIEASVVSETKIKEIFNEIKKNKSKLQYDKYVGGCEARALEIAIMLDQMSIKSIKVFINEHFYFRGVGWNLHVAPVIFVLKKDKIVPFVLDPTANDFEPLSLLAWYSAIGKKILDPVYFTNQYIYKIEDINLELNAYQDKDLDAKEKALNYLKKITPNGKSWLQNLVENY